MLQQFQSSSFVGQELVNVVRILWTLLYLNHCVSVTATGCGECTLFVETFKHGMKQTEKAHFGGGNTAWETEKLGKYSRSETRLVEILEHACKKTDTISAEKDDEHKCHGLIEDHEDVIENWYFHKQATDPDFQKWLCIESLKVCCPPNTFGPDCESCPGEPDRPCFGRGKCEGAGTRTGTGKCKCDSGYQGKLCRLCSSNYFASTKNDTHISCEKCDIACKAGCNHGGPSGCIECKPGWTMVQDVGCQDVDECQMSDTLCNEEKEKCQNTMGSYQCQCRQGYKRENNECVVDLSATAPVPILLGLYADEVLRYCSVGGLLVALMVIMFRRSTILVLLFILTMAIVMYIESDAVTQYLRNITAPLNLTAKTDL